MSEWECDFCGAIADRINMLRFINSRCGVPPGELKICKNCLIKFDLADADNPIFNRGVKDWQPRTETEVIRLRRRLAKRASPNLMSLEKMNRAMKVYAKYQQQVGWEKEFFFRMDQEGQT